MKRKIFLLLFSTTVTTFLKAAPYIIETADGGIIPLSSDWKSTEIECKNTYQKVSESLIKLLPDSKFEIYSSFSFGYCQLEFYLLDGEKPDFYSSYPYWYGSMQTTDFWSFKSYETCKNYLPMIKDQYERISGQKSLISYCQKHYEHFLPVNVVAGRSDWSGYFQPIHDKELNLKRLQEFINKNKGKVLIQGLRIDLKSS